MLLAILLNGLCLYSFAQTSTPSHATPTASWQAGTDGENQTGGSQAGAQANDGSGQTTSPGKLSPDDAENLLHSIDDIFKFASSDSGLPIKNTVKRELVSRDEVAKYIEERFDQDEDAKRLERSELLLKKLGLLPADFHLRPFLVSMLREQIAGYYDFKKKKVFLLDWIAPDEQRPVMAHELTHALQDQNFDLEKWTDAKKTELGKKEAASVNGEILLDEDSTARGALVEGQGMAVLIDYMLAPSGKTMLEMPEMVDAMRNQMTQTGESPVFDNAPLLLRESLIFPYRDGLGFIQALLTNGGKQLAFTKALQNPPENTFEILNPQEYMSGHHIAALRMPDMKALTGKDYDRYDVGAIGEFDIQILLRQFGQKTGIATSWRGGAYYSAQKHSQKGSEALDSLALVYLSRWRNHADARQFARIYSEALEKKYGVNAEADATAPELHLITPQGPVYVWIKDEYVLVSESFDTKLAQKLRDAIFDEKQPLVPQTQGELSWRVVMPLARMGMMKQALKGIMVVPDAH